MKNAVLDPAIMFIAKEDWADEVKRDRFLEHLSSNLAAIEQYSAAKILWNSDLESCLWGHPENTPWLCDKPWRNRFFSRTLIWLRKNTTRLADPSSLVACNVVPAMSCSNTAGLECLLVLIHQITGSHRDAILCLGLENAHPPSNRYTFNCDCCPQSLTPSLVNDPNEWLAHIDLEDDDWYQEATVLTGALEIVRRRHLHSASFLYEFEFTGQFISDVRAATIDRSRILEQMARRLTLTERRATQDGGLDDHLVHSNKQRRFKVTEKHRIHYVYQAGGVILFLRYYEKHDIGLAARR